VILLSSSKMTARTLKLKRTAPWLARLALFALFFQISAVDHQMSPADAVGVVGTSDHHMHCHGAVGSCANSGAEMPAAFTQSATLPLIPAFVLFVALADIDAPADAELAVGSKPPRI
jgi:hypothetical protein